MLAWSTDPNPWKRRSAILCQLPAKRATDLDLLVGCIAPSLGERDFFLRTAQRLLGHSSIQVTANIYTHLEAQDSLAAALKLNNYLDDLPAAEAT